MSTLDPLEDPPQQSWLTGKRLIGISITILIVLRVAIDLIPIRVHTILISTQHSPDVR